MPFVPSPARVAPLTLPTRPPPAGATLRIQENKHGTFGATYREVVVEYDPRNKAAAEYAFKCEEHAPSTWAEADMAPPAKARRRR